MGGPGFSTTFGRGTWVVACVLFASFVMALAPARLAAAGGCTFVAAINPGTGDPGSAALSAAPEQEITFWGTFIPNATVALDFFHDGVPYGDYTPGTADASGNFLFVHEFRDDQLGEWRVIASVADTECAGEVMVTVGGVVPDTAMRGGSDLIGSTALVAALLWILVASSLTRRRTAS